MDPDARTLLSLPRLPARLTAEQAATLLGFTTEGIAYLVGAKMLKPLGRERPGSPILLASEEVLRLSADRQWLNRATDVVRDRHRSKNAARRHRLANGDNAGVSAGPERNRQLEQHT